MKDPRIPETPGWLRILRLGLLCSACGWGISFWFTFVPWQNAAEQLRAMGAKPLHYDPLLDYWLKMASSVFGCIGLASALACWKPDAFEGLVKLVSPFHLFVGTTLLVAAIQNHLTPPRHPMFIPDITFCYLTALLTGLPLLCGKERP
ncbi:hypothetical protein KBB96_15100 [Luteolibacter ambystomatis]|uniref:Uncharacterized protein n=1 Tax=Luteolibacter ambystomatis TaxID=2824561 RepID=A0A975IZT6_9BACT|nr:hypothetical protein [Luteolibacter ambystomatis]QUE50190.1 hypothetical protein KBB96_15100 [Luteolibacter ambystomatis]